MASVISSSPRCDGRIRSIAAWTAGLKIYSPTSVRSLGGCYGFSTSAATLPSPFSVATPNCRGSGTFFKTISASAWLRRNCSTMGQWDEALRAYLAERKVPRKHGT
jgi:hypothetical protein